MRTPWEKDERGEKGGEENVIMSVRKRGEGEDKREKEGREVRECAIEIWKEG